jgi:hypothetical protein
MHRSKVNRHIEQITDAIHVLQPASNIHKSRQLLRTGPFLDQVCSLQKGVIIAFCRPEMHCQQTGQWWFVAFLRSIHPGSKVTPVIQAERWDSLQLPATLVRRNTSLGVLYTLLERGRVRKRCSGRVIIYFISIIIVSFAKGFSWGLSIYSCYDVLCQYSRLLRSFMSLYAPLCRFYASLCLYITLLNAHRTHVVTMHMKRGMTLNHTVTHAERKTKNDEQPYISTR